MLDTLKALSILRCDVVHKQNNETNHDVITYDYFVTQMNRQEHIEFCQEIQEYLQKNNVHAIFDQLLQQIILEKPKSLIDFIIQQLETPPNTTFFVVGPPGLSIANILKKALPNSNEAYHVFNFGQQLASIQKMLPPQQKEKVKACRLVNNEVIKSIVDKIEKKVKSDKNMIIEGFPKNLSQAHLLQKKGICVKNLLIVNVIEQGLQVLCSQKIEALNPGIQPEQKIKLAQAATLQHQIYLKEIKNFYRKYKEIDITFDRTQEYILQEINKALSIQTIQAQPRNSTQLILVGAPYSGRTTLGKQLAFHYNLVYISTSFLISQEIRRDTIHGRKVKKNFINNELIDNFLIQKLIEQRITKKDCRMQGFVLEGYPKNKEQFQNIKNMKLDPTMIIAIDTPKEISQSRNDMSKQKFDSRYQKWKEFEGFLREAKENIFWTEPRMGISNMCEEVVHELQKQFY